MNQDSSLDLFEVAKNYFDNSDYHELNKQLSSPGFLVYGDKHPFLILERGKIFGDLKTVTTFKDYVKVYGHGCNCFCKQKNGVAKEFVERYRTDTFPLEGEQYIGDINKLGTGEAKYFENEDIHVCNLYTQYVYKTHPLVSEIREKTFVNYSAITMALCNVYFNYFEYDIAEDYENILFIIPFIGAGLANGDPIKILDEFKDAVMNIAIIIP